MSKRNPSFSDDAVRKMVESHLSEKKNSSIKPPPQSAGGGLDSLDGSENPFDEKNKGLFDITQLKPAEVEQPTSFPTDIKLGNESGTNIGYRDTGLMAGIEDNINGGYQSPIQKQESEHLKNLSDIYERVQGKKITDKTGGNNGEINQGRDIPVSEKVSRFAKNELLPAFASGLDRLGQMGALLPSSMIDIAGKQKPAFFEGLGILGDWIKAPKANGEDNLATQYLSSLINAPAEFQQKLQEKAANNMDSEQLGKMAERSLGLPEEFNPFSPNNAVVKMYAERAKKNEDLAFKNYNGGITKAISDGNYADAGKLTALGIVQSLPLMVGLAASRGSGASELGSLGLMGLGSFGQTYQDLKAENPDIDKQLLFGNAVLTGVGESGSELIGTNLIYNQGLKLLRRGGTKEAEEVVKSGIRGYVDAAFKKFFVGAAALDEGSTELVNQVWKNFLDKHTGVKPDIDYMDGAWDAFIVGNGAGAAFSAPFHAASKVVSMANKKSVRSYVEQNSAIAPFLSSPNISATVKEKLMNEVAANNEAINNTYEQDAEKAKILTPKQQTKVEKINIDIDAKEAIAANPEMPQPIRDASAKSAKELETQADEVIKEAEKRIDDLNKVEKATKVATTPEQLVKQVAEVEQHADDAKETPEFQSAVENISKKVTELKKVKPKENEDTTIKNNLLAELEADLEKLKVPIAPVETVSAPVIEPQTTTNEETPIVPVQSPSETEITPQASEVPTKEVGPEATKYKSTEKQNDRTYVRDSENKAVEITNAKPADIGIDGDFFVHPALKNGGFVVSEGTTGARIASGATEQAAIDAAKSTAYRVTERGANPEAFYNVINTQVEKIGKTPRYENNAASDTGTTEPAKTNETAKQVEPNIEPEKPASSGTKRVEPKPETEDEFINRVVQVGKTAMFDFQGKAVPLKISKINNGVVEFQGKPDGWRDSDDFYGIVDLKGPNAKSDFLYNNEYKKPNVEEPNPAEEPVKKTVKIGNKENTEIGKNIYGEKLFEDENGVRSKSPKDYPNVYSTEPVQIIPGRGTYIDKANRSDDFQTVEERPKKTKVEKVDDEIDTAFKDFAQSLGKTLNSSGISAETIEKGIKLVGLYAKKGVYQFEAMVGDAYGRFGDQVKDIMDGFKAAYSSFYSQAADDVADQMTDPREVRKFNIDNFLNNQNNERGSEPNPVEENAPAISSGEQSTEISGTVPNEQTNGVPGTSDDTGSQIGNEADPGQQAVATGDRAGSTGNGADAGRGDIGGNPTEDTGRSVRKNVTKTLKPEDQNHQIKDSDVLVPTGAVGKFNANVDAIFLLKKLESENRNPSPLEKQQLAQFVGWGGLASYLNVRNNSDTEVVEAYMNGTDALVYKTGNFYTKVNVNFSKKGPVDFSKFDSATDLIADIRKELAKEDYSITPDAIRAPMLQSLLSKEEYQSAQTSTISAHFTDKPVVKAMWNIIDRLGFKGGKVLESSFGIGHLFGLMPENLRDKTSLTAYELDSLTGRMATKLYPQASVTVDGFENSRVPLNSQDLVVTNVPFGQNAPYDRLYPELSKFSLHNYFIAKNLKMLKPGGIGVMISSSSTMDANASAKFREWSTNPTGGNSYLVGAIRLPNNAFDENAGTQVTTDILIYQKRGDNLNAELEQPYRYTTFLKTGEANYGEQVNIDVNEYYIANPDNMLGEMMTAFEAGSGALYGNGSSSTLKAPANFDISSALNTAIDSMPKNINDQAKTVNLTEEPETIDAMDKKEGSLFLKDNKLYKVDSGTGEQVVLDSKNADIAKRYVGVKTDLLELIKLEQQANADEAVIDNIRTELNKKYDEYVKKHGNVNGRTSAFLDDYDIDFPIVASLENVSRKIESTNGKDKIVQEVTKGDILSKRVNFPRVEPTTATDIKDAIDISLNFKNGININYISSLLSEDADVIKDRLLSQDLAYENPDTGLLEAPDEYLSGYVRDKLKKAQIALLNDPKFQKNVDELSKVIPEDIPASLISHTLGSSWIPANIFADFANKTLGTKIEVQYLERAGKFAVNQGYSGIHSALNTNTYSAGGKTGVEILTATLNNSQIVIMDTWKEDGKTKTAKNPEKTAAAQAMQQQMQDEFEQYVKDDEAIQIQTERIYNDIFNGQILRTYRVPQFEHYPGAAHTISLREHQKRAVSRGLSESTLFAHEVGSGKTFTIITTAMEMRRLGTAKKPLISVKNSTRGQFVSAFKLLYPGAKILAPTDKELSADGRKKLFAKITTGDWDAVILPESQLSMIPDDPARQKAYIVEQIDEMKMILKDLDKRQNGIEYRQLERGIKDLEKEHEELSAVEQETNKKRGGKSEAKKIADKSLSIESGLRESLDRRTDNIFNFEEMGIDAMLVDEAHSYKRLGFQTQMKNIKGIDTSKSKKSQSVMLKVRWVQEKTGGKNVGFYTGTPISNTMAEAWTMMKYVRPDILEHMGIEYFDQFAKTFGQVIPSLEQSGGGTYKVQNRFAKFQNLPEFITAFKAATDVVLSSDVREFQETNALPKLKDGKITQVVIEQTPELQKQIKQFRETLEWFANLSGKEKKENSHIPLVIFNKAKQASIDLRLLDPNNVDSAESKVNTAIKNALAKYKETTANKGVQMIFSDMYQSPEPKNEFLDEDGLIKNPAYGKARFNLFNDIRDKLIAGGVKPDEIVIFTEPKYDKAEKKEATFDLANAGKVRFLLGTTERMGVGVNAQQKMVALHHLDAPARPMDFEQRNGRIVRQGNENDIVEVFAYGVAKTLDSSAFQRLATKQKFINQVMKGEGVDRVTEDPADEVAMTFDEMMAQLSDSPFAMQKLLIDNKVRSEKTKRDNFNGKLKNTNRTYRNTQGELSNAKASLIDEKKHAAIITDKFGDGNISSVVISGVEVKEKFGEAINGYLDKMFEKFNSSPSSYAKGAVDINGIQVQLELKGVMETSPETHLRISVPKLQYTVPELGITHDIYGNAISVPSASGNGLLASFRSKIANVQDEPARTERHIIKLETDLIQLEKDAKATFDETKLNDLEAESASLQEKMLADNLSKKDEVQNDETNTGAAYILDQSNVSGILNTLDGMKSKGGMTLSLIVPIPPAIWNGAIEVMKSVVKATNSTQKAIRVAARYIINQGGTKAMAGDFTQVMNDTYGPDSEFAKKLNTIVNRINENKVNLQERISDIENGDTSNFNDVKAKLVALMADARKMDLIKQGIAKADNAANAIQAVAAIKDADTAISAIGAVKSFLGNVGYNKALQFANSAYNRLNSIDRTNKMTLTPTTKQLAAINPKSLTPAELDEYLELTPVLVNQLDGKDTGLIADNDIALFIDKVNARMDEDIKAKLMARYTKLALSQNMTVEEMKEIINESKEDEAEKEANTEPTAFKSAQDKKRSIVIDVLDENLEDLKAKQVPSDKSFMVQGLINIDKSMLSTGDLIRLNQVVTNITVNDKYTGAGYFSKISQGISQIKKYQENVNKVGGGFRPITFDKGLKDRFNGSRLPILSLTDKYFHLNTYESVGKATDELLSYGIGNGYQKQKSEMKLTMDGLDKVVSDAGLATDRRAIHRIGAFAELNAYLVGDKRTREEQFQDNKNLFRQSLEVLENSKYNHEQAAYKMLSDIWNDIEGLGSVADLKGFLTPEEQKVYDYIQKVGQDNFNRLYDNNEMYGDSVMKEKANYVHRRYLKLREAGVKLDIVNDDPITAAVNGTLGQSGTKKDVKVTKRIPAGRYIDYNIVKSFKVGLNETLNDVHTLGERIKSNFVLNSPAFEKILSEGNDSGKANLNILKDSIKQMVNLQRGVAKIDMDMYNGANKLMNFFRQTFYTKAVGTVTAALPQYLSSATFALAKLNNPSSYMQSLHLFGNYVFASGENMAKSLIKAAGSGTANRDLQGDTQLEDAMDNFTENVMGKYVSPKVSQVFDGLNEKLFASLKFGDRVTSLHTWLAGYIDSLIDQGVIKSAFDFTPEMLEQHVINPNTQAATSAESMVTMSNNESDSSRRANKFVAKTQNDELLTDLLYPVKKFAVAMNNKLWLGVRNIAEWDGGQVDGVKTVVGALASIAIFNAIRDYILNNLLFDAAGKAIVSALGLGDEEEDERLKLKMTVEEYEKYKADKRLFKFGSETASDVLLGGQNVFIEQGVKNFTNYFWEMFGDKIQEDAKKNKEYAPKSIFYVDNGATSMFGIYGETLGLFIDPGSDKKTPLNVFADIMQENSDEEAKTRRAIFSVGLPLANQFLLPSADANRVLNRVRRRVEKVDESLIDIKLKDKNNKEYRKYHGGMNAPKD